MKNKILLVGGTGYIGSVLNNYLKDKYQIYRTSLSKSNEKKEFIIDLKVSESFNSLINYKFDIVFFLASSIKGIGKKNLNNIDLEINTICLANFIDFLKKNKLTKKIVYMSSMTVYAPSKIIPVNELFDLSPTSIYGLSKKIAEEIIKFNSLNSNIKSLVLRIPGVYGGNRKNGLLYKVIKNALHNNSININTENLEYWECIELNDLCFLLKKLLGVYKWNSKYEEINIGYGEKIDLIDTVQLIHNKVNSKAKLYFKNKSYSDFYLDVKKLKDIIDYDLSFKNGLFSYIKQIKNEIRDR
ncbi:MAG: hypothetical protein CMC88_04020 [Flavobacteriaceae bacterium]|nr:hypothetical protein [Flavobacteriaceae bacterium]|tara:strand:- start:98875 stop:99771 length:897 start_codon:yes stop_codon:yes gene_type:complete